MSNFLFLIFIACCNHLVICAGNYFLFNPATCCCKTFVLNLKSFCVLPETNHANWRLTAPNLWSVFPNWKYTSLTELYFIRSAIIIIILQYTQWPYLILLVFHFCRTSQRCTSLTPSSYWIWWRSSQSRTCHCFTSPQGLRRHWRSSESHWKQPRWICKHNGSELCVDDIDILPVL